MDIPKMPTPPHDSKIGADRRVRTLTPVQIIDKQVKFKI